MDVLGISVMSLELHCWLFCAAELKCPVSHEMVSTDDGYLISTVTVRPAVPLEPDVNRPPLVLLHGFAGGSAFMVVSKSTCVCFLFFSFIAGNSHNGEVNSCTISNNFMADWCQSCFNGWLLWNPDLFCWCMLEQLLTRRRSCTWNVNFGFLHGLW